MDYVISASCGTTDGDGALGPRTGLKMWSWPTATPDGCAGLVAESRRWRDGGKGDGV